MFMLFSVIFAIVAAIIDHILGTTFKINMGTDTPMPLPYGWVYLVYGLFIFIPSLALWVRRLHDTGKSGWFVLISFIPLFGGIWLLVLACTEGNKGDNKYGPDPKAIPEMATATNV